ncbi:GNAT family N-acetyltransferase [Microbacterium sp. LRZ72]|uniref:GNAT family N-acetyltransferase n=1 Tax=Microbacterium sp. LRZ72 TaxID=2942481 RepID=UPI00299FE5A9|nr:GNAT family N-acetyltransferase [Microbacterium sp. LRZ72]MDX2377445.1 GNAT family N-acetyltransferase [Microbacterium sp. LRZ72]
MATYRVRPAAQSDGNFLGDMVCEAANWRPGAPRPRHDVLAAPEHGRYIAGWMRPGDAGFVAVDPQDQPVGAAWYRTFPCSEPGFGYVGTGVPELIIGVRPIWRAHGVGRALMTRLADRARQAGFARLSLSVDRDNFATTLYRSEGFVVVRAGLGRDVMVKRLR